MDIHRVMPTTIMPERQSVMRRERDGQNRRDEPERQPQEKARDAAKSGHAANTEDAEAQVREEQAKGRRLNVSA